MGCIMYVHMQLVRQAESIFIPHQYPFEAYLPSMWPVSQGKETRVMEHERFRMALCVVVWCVLLHVCVHLLQHGSLVREIEEAVKREVLAASTLQERPASPLSYAQNQARVVMETVKSTMQSQQKREKLIQEIEELLQTSTASEVGAEPLRTSSRVGSVGVSTSVGSVGVSTSESSFHGASSMDPRLRRSSSPSLSETGSCSVSSVGEELRRHRGSYVPPEKLQIVKPLEGTVHMYVCRHQLGSCSCCMG